MMKVYIDIETIPAQPEDKCKEDIEKNICPPASMKKRETIDDWHAGVGKYAGAKDEAVQAKYEATSFDGAKGQICCISFAVDDGEIFSCTDKDIGEYGLLLWFSTELKTNLNKNGKIFSRPFFVGHYISGFDLRFLYQRFVINNVAPSFELPFYGKHGHDFYDTMVAWSGFKSSIGQNDLCVALGIEGKPSHIDGSKVWSFYKDGKISDIETYNRDDVSKVRQIYKRLTFSV